MKRSFWPVLVSCLVLLVGSGLCTPEKTYLTILHTNDTQSTLLPYGPHGEWGGIARMSTRIKELKAGGGNVLVLNAGDVFVGSFEFNKYLGYPELKIMEGLYDAMCLGNHEFDLGLDVLTGVLTGAIAGGSPIALPVLCANIDLDGQPALKSFVKPYIVKDVGGIKVGLFGVIDNNAVNYSADVFWASDRPVRGGRAGGLHAQERRGRRHRRLPVPSWNDARSLPGSPRSPASTSSSAATLMMPWRARSSPTARSSSRPESSDGTLAGSSSRLQIRG